ncbi:MAG: outer membrane protein assembly factor BamA [Thermodesulfovibrionia bacterium]
MGKKSNSILKIRIIHRFTVVAICLLFFSMYFPVIAQVSAEEMPIIKLIEIKGNKKIEQETILANIKSKIGSPFSQKIVQEDIKKLYSLGYFDDVRVEIETFEGGINLIFIIKGKPTVVSVDFQGNKKFEIDELKEKVTIAPGAIANHFLITDNVKNIISFYESEGYLHAKVLPIIRKVSEDAVAITYQIDEGSKVKIKKITIEGNKSISSRNIKKAMKTKERWIFSFLTGSGIYKKEEIKTDMERIKKLYQSNGYIQVVISDPVVTLNPERTELYIKITLSEGDKFKIGEISFKGNTIFNSTEFYQHIETSTGKIFNRSALRDDIDSILNLYTEKGYATADINPIFHVNSKEKLVNIVFSVTEGEIFRIGRIEIIGNTKTRDKVIRREMRLDEGETYNSRLLKRSYQRISNLNFFDTVELNPKPQVKEKLVDIDIKVKEKLTGMLTFGGGYSSIDKLIVTGEITQINLFGKGLYLKLRADFSASRTNYNISLRDPWFLDKPVSASINLYNDVFEYPEYDKEALGGSIGFGKELSEYVGGNIKYTFEDVTISDIGDDASSIIKEQEGQKITSSISPSIWRDTRDNYLDPTSGSKNSISATYAGIGGDNYFVKTLFDSLWYFPVIWDTTFSLRGRFGYASGLKGRKLPLYERFYVGGINTVRGLAFGEGGPRDETGEVIGGTKELIFNAEYIVPIEKNLRLKGVVFFDAGKSFDDYEEAKSLRTTAGFGVRWMSPFGPIRLEWGYNLSKKADESSSKIEFAVGGLF